MNSFANFIHIMNAIARTLGLSILTMYGVVFQLCAETIDEKSLIGEWMVLQAEFRGEKAPDDVTQKLKVTIKNKIFSLTPLMHNEGKWLAPDEMADLHYVIDTKANPNEIDLIFADEHGEFRMLGIFEIHDKNLKVVWQHDGKGRPKEFKAMKTPSQMLLVLKKKDIDQGVQ